MTKTKFKTTASILILLGFALIPYFVLADGWNVGDPPEGLPNVGLEKVILNITNWTLGIVAFLAVLFLVWGGVNYVTAAGNEEQIETAKIIIRYALLGLVVAGISYAAVKVIVDVFIGGKFT